MAEAAIAFHAARLGIEVSRPLFEHGRYDLVMDVAGQLHRVQCKWAQRMGDVVLVRLASNRLTPAGYVRTHYLAEEIDAVAAYCADVDRCYFLPAEFVAGRNAIHLRLVAAKNGQEAGVHWAKRFELSRLVGRSDEPATREVRIPGASIPVLCDDRVVVSAHDFRKRFGRYMELAERGTEINVTRYGQPFVRLVAAKPAVPD